MTIEEEFLKAFELYEIGNSSSCIFIIKDKIEKKAKTLKGDLISIKLIRDKYEEYNRWWISKYGKNDPKYVPTKEKKLNVYDFLIQGGYNNTYVREDQPRDFYLFGNMDKEEMIKKTKNFIDNAGKRKTNTKI